MNRGRPAREMADRPLYECHQAEMRWNRRADLKAGGYWRCSERYKPTSQAWRMAHQARLREYMARWRKSHPEHLAAYMRRYRYGLEAPAYDALMEQQRGRCPLCDVPAKEAPRGMLHVDHDHSTGRVRGLICFRCNTALERVELRDWLPRTIAYLSRENV